MKSNENIVGIDKASAMLGVSKDTLRNWDLNDKLKPIKTKGGHRRYKTSDILSIVDGRGKIDKRNKIVVYAYVCGDILHKGHILHLKNAKLLGDFLIVGVLTDEAVMEKKERPVISFEERFELVQCLKMVDMAVPQHEYSPEYNVREFKPNILMESTSHDDKLVQNSKNCMKEIGGKVIVASYYPDQSSSAIKEKIKKEI